jgi:hypothetical protein
MQTTLLDDGSYKSQNNKGLKVKIIGAVLFGIVGTLGYINLKGGSVPQSAIQLSYDYGCGAAGKCWSWCNGGNGWCYTSAQNVCSNAGDCDSGSSCTSGCTPYSVNLVASFEDKKL